MKLLNAAIVIVAILLIFAGVGVGIATFFTVQTIASQGNFVPVGIAMLFFVTVFMVLLITEIGLLIGRWVMKEW